MEPRDEDLVRRALAGDEGGFRALVERHAHAVFRTAYGVTGDRQAAEDAAQETFLAVSRSLRRFDLRRSLRAWILGIAAHKASKVARGRARAARREENAMVRPIPPASPEDAADRRETGEALNSALAELPVEQRVPVLLHYREGLTHAEVAQALDIAAGTAKSRIGRAIERMRDLLARRGVALSAAQVGAALGALGMPEASAALIDASAAEGARILAGTAAGTAVVKKAIVAAIVLATATVGVYRMAEPRGPAARNDARPPVAFEGGAAAPNEAAEGPAGGSPASPAPVAGTRAGGDPAAEHPGGAPAKGEAYVLVGGKRVPIADLRRRGAVVAGDVRIGDASTPGGVRPGGLAPVPGREGPSYAPVPRTLGDATLEGRVLDEAGNPLPGAEIWRVADDAPEGEETVLSGEHLDRIGTAGEDGSFTIGKQRAGAFRLFANFEGWANVPMKGLETRHAVAVRVEPGGRAEALLLRVPVALSAYGGLRGRLVDGEGRGVGPAEILVDLKVRRIAGRDGTFDFGLLPEGAHTLSLAVTGYEPHEEELVIEGGRALDRTIRLELSATGSLSLEGLVLDDAGRPVPDAGLYLTTGEGTIRRVHSDAQGAYVFADLPDDLAGSPLRLNVWPPDAYMPFFDPAVVLPRGRLDVRVARAVELVLRVVSASGGTPLRQVLGSLERERTDADGQVVRAAFHTFSRFHEEGTFDGLRAPVGERVWLRLQAPGHEETELEMLLDGSRPREEITVALAPAPVPGGDSG